MNKLAALGLTALISLFASCGHQSKTDVKMHSCTLRRLIFNHIFTIEEEKLKELFRENLDNLGAEYFDN